MRRRTRIMLLGSIATLFCVAAALLYMMGDRFTPPRTDISPAPMAGPPRTRPAETTATPPARVDTAPLARSDGTIETPPEPLDSIFTTESDSTFQYFVPTMTIPVAGVRPEQLIDTYSDARSEGRVHNAIDIPAAHGTPVLAAADGRIVKLFASRLGGTTIYQSTVKGDLIFYYAHLDRYADGIAEGQSVRRGQTIAYVGNTGNAGVDNYHLHFAIWIVTDPKRYWDGITINPYPLLRRTPAIGPGV
jgi:peptidoglycan LD-endopeptidase LytH